MMHKAKTHPPETGAINTALCAFGMSGQIFHAPFIQANPGFNLYAVWERSKKNVSALYPQTRSFDTLDSMLSDKTIELVIVNTPNYTHFEFAKKALLAGKHVLVEKCFTVSTSEAEELITLAAKEGRQLSVFHNRRFDSDFKTVKSVFDQGLLGDIIEAEFRFDRFKPELSAKLHKETDQPGSGLLHDLGPHLIDQALYLFGMPLSVFGFTRKLRPGTIVNDYFEIILFYHSHTVRLRSSLLAKAMQPAYILIGRMGSFSKIRADIQEDNLKSGLKPGVKNWGEEPDSFKGEIILVKEDKDSRDHWLSLPGNYMQFYDELYASIRHDIKSPVSGKDGLNVVRVIRAVQESERSGAVVSINLI